MGEPSIGRKLYSVLMFVFVSALGGLLVAGLAVPTAGMASEITKLGAGALTSIPADIETPPPAEGSKVLMGDGTLLTNFFEENRLNVPLEDISPTMQQALISVEDQRFYEHGALDLRSTLRGLVRTSVGNIQGGSTLTQQYIKLALLDKALADNDKEAEAAAYDRTFARKLLELRYAMALEERLSKDQILERYLNLVYYGEGAYGVEAAARRYWGTSAKKLDLAQSAMLAGLVRNPATTDPIDNTKIAIERRNNVLDVMLGQKVITKEEAAEAKEVGYNPKKAVRPPHGCVGAKYEHLCSVVEESLLLMPSLGPTPEARERLLKRGGLVIKTEIDPRTQEAAQKSVSNFIHPKDPVLGMMVMIEPGSGLIKAVAQSRYEIGNKAGQSWWNYPMEPELGGAEGYFGGSTFKIFTLAAAINKGYPTSRSYTSEREKNWKGERFTNCEGSFPQYSDWDVTNAGSGGSFDMYSGAKHSVNNYFVALEQDVGLCDVSKMAETLGLKLSGKQSFASKLTGKQRDNGWVSIQNPSLTLGTANISPISLANSAATLAARGMHCEPRILKSVKARNGTTYEVPSANCEQAIPKDVADRVNDILRGPFHGGTASAAYIPGYDIAGKTGTDSNTPTIWTVGYTPDLVGVSTITIDREHKRYKNVSQNRRSLVGAPIRGGTAYLRGSSGGEAGAGIWRPAMTVALKGSPGTKFTDAPAYKAKEIDVPSCSGLGMSACRDVLREEGFATVVSEVTNDAPAGSFLGTNPSNRAPQYGTITLVVSAGPPPPPAENRDEDDAEEDDGSDNPGGGRGGR
ncbi:MAG: transglycosylase domain-containing protein [Propioniciclava sp.]